MSSVRLLPGVVAAVVSSTALAGIVASPATAATAPSTVVNAAPAPNGAAGTDLTVSLPFAGLTRSYRLFVPTKLPAASWRLIVALHPMNGSAAGFESSSNFDAGAATTATLVAYPSGVDASWNAGRCCGTAEATEVDDVGFLDAVIDDVESRYAVDVAHIAIGGFSNGSLMSYRYVCERSARVHTVFIGSGALVAPSCTFARPVQVLHMHGMQDTVVPWFGTTTSPFTTDGVMPSVPTTVNAIAGFDGCSGAWSGSAVDSYVNKYVALSCPAGASVTVFQSQPLMHGWVTGASAVPTYGINETNQTWAWLLGVWSQT